MEKEGRTRAELLRPDEEVVDEDELPEMLVGLSAEKTSMIVVAAEKYPLLEGLVSSRRLAVEKRFSECVILRARGSPEEIEQIKGEIGGAL